MFDKNDKGLFSTTKKIAEDIIKRKKTLIFINVSVFVIQIILIVVIVGSITFLPIMFFNNIKDGFYNGVDKVLNFLTVGKWMSSENHYYLKLENEYDKFQSYNYKEGEFDIPLLAATSHYANMFGPNDFDYANNPDKEHKDYNPEDLEYAIKEDTSRTFYTIATNELGTSTTIIPSKKRLIGHLVDVKVVTHCVPLEDFGDVVDIAKIYWSQWKDFAKLLSYTIENDTTEIITSGNIVKFIRLIHAYKKHGYNYVASELMHMVNVVENDNVFLELIRILDQSELGGCDEDNEVPVPTIYRFINYDNYKRYLKEFYLKQFYINCKKCPYRDYSDKNKDVIADRMIEDIFNQKKMWDYLNENQVIFKNTSSIYIPGLSSMPLPVAPGGQLIISSPFGERIHPITGKRKMHNGLDLAYPTGTPLYAIADGEVVHAGCQSNGCSKGWGKYVKIKHDTDGDGVADYYSLYAHMSIINTSNGAIVGGGQKIGEVGNTGASTGPHLHLEIHDKNGNPIDPLPILKGIMEGNSVFDNNATTTYYNQGDYKNVAYCKGMNSDNGEATISSSGCLPTAYAMVAVKLGYKSNPVAVANYICQNTKYRIEGSGTSSAFLTDPQVMNNFKIRSTRVNNRTIDNVVSILKDGKPIIVSVKGGHFNPSGAGHFIVIDSIDSNGNIKVLDPGNRSKTNRSYTKDEINTYVINHINSGMWYFEKG